MSAPNSSQARSVTSSSLHRRPGCRRRVRARRAAGPRRAVEVRPLAIQIGARRDRPRLAPLVRAAARHEEPGAGKSRGRRRADAERHEHHGGVVDGVQQSRRLVVMRPEEGCGGRRRRGEHHGVRLDGRARGRDGPAARRRPFERSAGEERRTSTPRRRRPAAIVSTSDAMPPSSAQKSGGPSGSGGGTSARRARMRPPRRCAAARSGGNVAAADMSSTDPAWIPPISGSTSMSTTRRPSLRATSGPMARSPIGPRTSGRGSTASRARPSAPRTPTMPERAVGQNRVGIPSAWPSGSARRRPRAQPTHPGRRWARVRRPVPSPHTARRPRAGDRGTRRAQVDDASPEVLALQGPTELRRRLEDGDRRRAGPRGRPTGELPGRGSGH